MTVSFAVSVNQVGAASTIKLQAHSIPESPATCASSPIRTAKIPTTAAGNISTSASALPNICVIASRSLSGKILNIITSCDGLTCPSKARLSPRLGTLLVYTLASKPLVSNPLHSGGSIFSSTGYVRNCDSLAQEIPKLGMCLPVWQLQAAAVCKLPPP